MSVKVRKRTTKTQKLRAWRRGYAAGTEAKPFRSPYVQRDLLDQWISGYGIGARSAAPRQEHTS